MSETDVKFELSRQDALDILEVFNDIADIYDEDDEIDQEFVVRLELLEEKLTRWLK